MLGRGRYLVKADSTPGKCNIPSDVNLTEF